MSRQPTCAPAVLISNRHLKCYLCIDQLTDVQTSERLDAQQILKPGFLTDYDLSSSPSDVPELHLQPCCSTCSPALGGHDGEKRRRHGDPQEASPAVHFVFPLKVIGLSRQQPRTGSGPDRQGGLRIISRSKQHPRSGDAPKRDRTTN